VDAVVGRVEDVEGGREGCQVVGGEGRAGVRAEVVQAKTGGLVGRVVLRGHGDGTGVVYRCAAGDAGAAGAAGAVSALASGVEALHEMKRSVLIVKKFVPDTRKVSRICEKTCFRLLKNKTARRKTTREHIYEWCAMQMDTLVNICFEIPDTHECDQVFHWMRDNSFVGAACPGCSVAGCLSMPKERRKPNETSQCATWPIK